MFVEDLLVQPRGSELTTPTLMAFSDLVSLAIIPLCYEIYHALMSFSFPLLLHFCSVYHV